MATKSPRKPQPSIHPVIPAGIAIVVVGVLILLLANLGGDDSPAAAPVSTTTTTTTTTEPPPTTTTLPEPVDPATVVGAPLDVEPPTTYRVVYDVVENDLARTETITVRRPYDALVLSERDGKLLSGSASSARGLRTYLSDREGWLLVQPERHRATHDMRPAGAIGTLVELGFVERLDGEETYAGRSCRRFLTGVPPASTEPTEPSAEESTEFCIDDAGLVLHERWELDGDVVTERIATSVELDPTIDEAMFDPGPAVDNQAEYDQILTSIAVPADEETLASLRTDIEGDVVSGYSYDGAVFRSGNAGQGGGAGAEIARFYTSGRDLLEYTEQYADRPTYLGGGSAVRVAIEGWDEVWIVPTLRQSSVRARIDEFSYVELRHDDIGFLLEVLASITRR